MRPHADRVWHGSEHQTVRDPRKRLEWGQGRKVAHGYHGLDANLEGIFCRAHDALEQTPRRLKPGREGLPPHVGALDDDRIVHEKHWTCTTRLELNQFPVEYGPAWDHRADGRHGKGAVHKHGDALALVLTADQHVAHAIGLFTNEIFSFSKFCKVTPLDRDGLRSWESVGIHRFPRLLDEGFYGLLHIL